MHAETLSFSTLSAPTVQTTSLSYASFSEPMVLSPRFYGNILKAKSLSKANSISVPASHAGTKRAVSILTCIAARGLLFLYPFVSSHYRLPMLYPTCNHQNPALTRICISGSPVCTETHVFQGGCPDLVPYSSVRATGQAFFLTGQRLQYLTQAVTCLRVGATGGDGQSRGELRAVPSGVLTRNAQKPSSIP